MGRGESERRLPSREEFIPSGMLDEESAFRDFGGKSLSEVRELVAENFLGRQEHFMWMGIRAFCYYLPAFVDYFDHHDFDCQEVRLFCVDCDFRLRDFERQPGLCSCAERLLDGIRKVSRIFETDKTRLLADDFESEAEIVDARDKLAAVLERYEVLVADLRA